MFKQITTNKKYMLVAATILLAIISYHFAFKPTVEAWQLYVRLEKQVYQNPGEQRQSTYLERKNRNLYLILSQYKADTVALRSNTIGSIASIADEENVRMSEVPTQNPLYHGNSFFIQKLDFEGDYFALIKLLKRLESEKKIGVPRSATFKIVRLGPGGQDTKRLLMELFFEAAK